MLSYISFAGYIIPRLSGCPAIWLSSFPTFCFPYFRLSGIYLVILYISIAGGYAFKHFIR